MDTVNLTVEVVSERLAELPKVIQLKSGIEATAKSTEFPRNYVFIITLCVLSLACVFIHF